MVDPAHHQSATKSALFYLHKWRRLRARTQATWSSSRSAPKVFVVDNLIGQEEVVIKPLDNLLQGTPAWPVPSPATAASPSPGGGAASAYGAVNFIVRIAFTLFNRHCVSFKKCALIISMISIVNNRIPHLGTWDPFREVLGFDNHPSPACRCIPSLVSVP